MTRDVSTKVTYLTEIKIYSCIHLCLVKISYLAFEQDERMYAPHGETYSSSYYKFSANVALSCNRQGHSDSTRGAYERSNTHYMAQPLCLSSHHLKSLNKHDRLQLLCYCTCDIIEHPDVEFCCRGISRYLGGFIIRCRWTCSH